MTVASESLNHPSASAMPMRLRILTAIRLLGSMAESMWLSVALVAAFKIASTEGSGVVAVAAVLPGVVASPVLSYLTDRLQPQFMLKSALALRTVVLIAAVAGSIYSNALWVFVLLSGLASCSTVAEAPAAGTLLPWLVSTPAELVGANLRLTVADSAGKLIGPALGALVLEVAGIPEALWMTLAVAVVSFLASLGLRRDEHKAAAEHSHGVLREMCAGFATLSRQRGPLTIMLAVAAAFILQGLMGVVAVPLAYDTLKLGASGPGILMAAVGAGGIAAGFFLSALKPRRGLGRLFLAAAGVGGVFIACAGAASNVLIVIPSIVFFGAGLAGSLALGSTLIERFVPDELIGRVLGLFEAMMFCAEAVGAGLAPSLVSAIGMRATMFAAGGSLIVVLAMTLVAICRMDAQEGKASWMLDVLAQAKFLTALPLARYEQLARNAVQRDLSPGESACRQGEFGDQFYVIVSGEFEVLVDGERVRTLGPGDSFGDIALLRRIPRTATVTALDSARVVTVRRRAFLEAVTGRRSVAMYDDGELALPERRAWDPSPFLTREEASLDEQARSLTAIPLLSRLSPDAACELARHAEVIEAPAGTRLIEQGEEGDAYYVIATGEVFFSENGEIVVTLGPGHGFGELALLRNEPRAASAFTKTWATLVRFPAQSFLRALRPAEND